MFSLKGNHVFKNIVISWSRAHATVSNSLIVDVVRISDF